MAGQLPAVEPDDAAAAYEHARDEMRAEADRRRALAEADADARAVATNAATTL
ncbi:hypothetical protein ACN6LM_003889 [Streptomyces sp. SAS_281]|uniref:hypothetical protein n=1 Tax=Streptomyces sp. SAS_281 TaxID=3412744 RepID=UPI00403CB9F8